MGLQTRSEGNTPNQPVAPVVEPFANPPRPFVQPAPVRRNQRDMAGLKGAAIGGVAGAGAGVAVDGGEAGILRLGYRELSFVYGYVFFFLLFTMFIPGRIGNLLCDHTTIMSHWTESTRILQCLPIRHQFYF